MERTLVTLVSLLALFSFIWPLQGQAQAFITFNVELPLGPHTSAPGTDPDIQIVSIFPIGLFNMDCRPF